MAHKLVGSCHCGHITLEVNLSLAPDAYHPRVCDCNFCCLHNAAYLSDPKGSAIIQARDISNIESEEQGDELADFLLCTACGSLLGARWQEGNTQYGAINVRILTDPETLGKAVAASPKRFSPEQKIERWKELWFSEFMVLH